MLWYFPWNYFKMWPFFQFWRVLFRIYIISEKIYSFIKLKKRKVYGKTCLYMICVDLFELFVISLNIFTKKIYIFTSFCSWSTTVTGILDSFLVILKHKLQNHYKIVKKCFLSTTCRVMSLMGWDLQPHNGVAKVYQMTSLFSHFHLIIIFLLMKTYRLKIFKRNVLNINSKQ